MDSDVDCAQPLLYDCGNSTTCLCLGFHVHRNARAAERVRVGQYPQHLWPHLAQVGTLQVRAVAFGHLELPSLSQAST